MSPSGAGAKPTLARKRAHRLRRLARLALGLLSLALVGSFLMSVFVIFGPARPRLKQESQRTIVQPAAAIKRKQNAIIETPEQELQIPLQRQQVTTAISSLGGELRYFEPAMRLTQQDLAEARQREPLRSWLEPSSSQLLHLTDLNYPIEPSGSRNVIECDLDGDRWRGAQRTLFIVINSRNTNFKRRRRLRSSWANVAHIRQQLCPSDKSAPSADELPIATKATPSSFIATSGRVRAPAINQYLASHKKPARSLGERARIGRIELVFVLARGRRLEAPVDTSAPSTTLPADGALIAPNEIEPRLKLEAAANGDLLMANLAEHYHNITLKHLAIYKWLLRRQASPPANQSGPKGGPLLLPAASLDALLLKCDDDAQLDLEQLLVKFVEESGQKEASSTGTAQELRSGSGAQDRPVLMCAQFPKNSLVQRHRRTKWQLSANEWPFDTFPAYCSGLAYLSSLKLIEQLYITAHIMHLARPLPPLWIDDVYVTGVLLAALDAKLFQLIKLNPYFCYTRAQRERRQLELGQSCMAAEL